MSKKVIFLEAGRRADLINKFADLGCECYVYDTSIHLPLPAHITRIQATKWDEPSSKEKLRECVELIQPDLVVPCSCRAAYELAFLWGGPSSFYPAEGLCYDKKALADVFFNKVFYPTIDRVNSGKAIQKPRFGNGGKDIERISYNRDFNIDDYVYRNSQSVFQGEVIGKEYSVDCYYYHGKPIEIVPRERLRVVGGEVIESITVEKPEIIEVVMNITRTFNNIRSVFHGPICMQFIQDEQGKVWLIEINHRFGGGSTLSIEAGMNAPLWMLEPDKAKQHKFGSYKRELYLTRSFKDYYYQT